MKILFDANPLARSQKSGIGYFVSGLVSQLILNSEDTVDGYYFNFLGRHSIDTAASIKGVGLKSVRFVPGKLITGLQRLGVQMPLPQLLKPYDVAIFTNYSSLPTHKKTKRVCVIYDLCFLDEPQYVSDRNADYLKVQVPLSVRSADLIVTISEFTKSRIINHYGVEPNKIFVMPIPPLTTRTLVEPPNTPEKYILFVGTIEPRKNILGLLNEYEMLPSSIRDEYALVLAGGKGWKDEEIIIKIDEMTKDGLNIHATGYISDEEKAYLYSRASLCVMPSYYEGFGMPVIEGMAYGKAVICNNISVLHEVGGEAAVYFDSTKQHSLAKLLTELLNSPDVLKKFELKSLTHASMFPQWEEVTHDFRARIKILVTGTHNLDPGQ